MANCIEKESKTILNEQRFIDHYFWCKYTFSPYNGCEYACVYCDSRSEKYHLPEDYGNTVWVKTNAPALLEKRLSHPKILPDVLASGSTEAFQGAESRYHITHQCLDVIRRYRFPLFLATKSTLVTSEIEILNEIASNSWANVSFTVTTLHPEKARYLEPNAPTPIARLTALSQIKYSAPVIQSGILLMPIVPGFTDKENELADLIKRAKDNGADYILYGGGMTLRDRQALYFLNELKKTVPVLIPAYERLYHFRYHPSHYDGQYSPPPDYHLRISQTVAALCEKYGLPMRVKRYIPEDYRKLNYQIAERLFAESYLLELGGQFNTPLYWAAQNIQSLKESIAEIAQRNELSIIRNVTGKIKERVEKLIEELSQI